MLPVDVKMALINYHEMHKIDDVLGQIEVVNAKRFKVGGSLIKIPENPKPRDLVILDNLERLDVLRNSLKVHQYLAELADVFINALPEPYQSMVVDKYVNKLNCYELEEKYNYSCRQINRIIDRFIDRFIEVT
jgi:hypothetical protein